MVVTGMSDIEHMLQHIFFPIEHMFGYHTNVHQTHKFPGPRVCRLPFGPNIIDKP